jgi:phosphoribosylglycinamide formyltransferase-1
MAVLASGEGHTLQAVLDAIEARSLNAEVCCVISNNADAGVLQRARQAGIATVHLSAATHAQAAALDAALTTALQQSGAALILTAGYMKRLGPQVLATFQGRMINVHPSLLPKYGGAGMYGSHVHAAVLAAGESESGASVHFVAGDYDSGPLIAQASVPVLPGDTVASLEQRVKNRERLLLLQVLKLRAESGRFSGMEIF